MQLDASNLKDWSKLCIWMWMIFGADQMDAQFGGQRSFQFLNLPSTARSASLGGVNVSSWDQDVQMFLSNPALLDSMVDRHAGLTYQSLVADISYGTLTYVHDFETPGIWGVGIQYLNYGDFQGFDPSGTPTGSFNGSEFVLLLAYARPLGLIQLGADLKIMASALAGYSATALLLDIGGIFRHPEHDLTVGLTFRNMGVVLSDFTETSESELPFDVQLGVTYRPKHMPFRLSLTGYNLGLVNEILFDPTGTGEGTPTEVGTFDRIMRHIAIGTEVLVHRNFNLRLGYNHLVRQELRLAETSGGAGLSFGFLLRIKKFELAYTHSIYHTGGGYDYFTLVTDLNSFITKK
jgi:hypothetical protein